MVIKIQFPYNTERIPPTPLISSLVGLQTEEINLHFQDKLSDGVEVDNTRTPQKKRIISNKSRSSRIESSNELDLTGSPLKADFDPNEEFDNSDDDAFLVNVKRPKMPRYSGLQVKKARVLLSKLNTSSPLAANSYNFVLCDPTPGEDSPVLYLGNRFYQGKLVEVYQSTWSGPLPVKSVAGELEATLAEQTTLATNQTLKVESKADYLLCGGEEGESYLKLESRWTRSSALLESPPPDAITKLKICMMIGDERFACDSQNEEITQLEGLISGLNGQGLVWTGRDKDTSLEDEIMEALDSSRKHRPSFPSQDSDCDLVFSHHSRQDVDITDMLWTVLSRAQSYAELSHSFQFLFQTLLREEIRPFIYNGNRSGMAGILREIVRNGTLPDMSGSRPLVLLIEMGIEKLKRDSTHYLLSADLVSKEAVDPYLVSSEPSEALDLIKRLHMVVELAFACQTYLSLSTAALKSVVHSALLQFRQIQETHKVNLEFPVQTSEVKAQLENGNACFWQIRFTSEALTSVIQMQIERPLEVAPAMGKQLNGDETEPAYYIINHVQTTLN